MTSDRKPQRILMLTNSEYGAANIFLAAIHELLQLEPDLDIHLVSFNALSSAVEGAIEHALEAAPGARRPTFHELKARNLSQAITARLPRFFEILTDRLSPSISKTRGIMNAFCNFFAPWDAPDFISVYRQLEAILGEVQPGLTVVDPTFAPGWTLCTEHKLRWIIFQPNSIKELALSYQPSGQALWKFPAVMSGFDFPVPWYLIPLNIIYSLCFGISIFTDPRYPQVVKEVESELKVKVTSIRDMVAGPPPVSVLLGCRPEVDFPVSVVPDFLVPCGPIVRPAALLRDTDAKLVMWLAKGPTVYINMGTLKRYTEDEAIEKARAVRFLLDRSKTSVRPEMARLQVLWKLKRHGEYDAKQGSAIYSILGREIDEDRVRVVDWLVPEPSAVLESGHVVCSVNHGGASSWYEAMCTGVPQVILPVWVDTFDAALRAEYLGIGRWGSRKAAPSCKAEELGTAMVEVVLGPEAKAIKAKAKELAEICTSGGHGREKAAKEILRFMRA